MPGGFHPFHPGHKSLYDWAIETFGKQNVYVAATNDTKARPFPFDVKQKLAGMAGVPAQRFIQVKSPFNALAYKGIIGDPSNTTLVFIRSEKDKTSHPLPDQIRKSDGNMGYLISYKDDQELETADTHGYLAYGPTIDFDFAGMSIKSASELRATWPEMNDEDKMQAAELMYPGNAQTAVELLNRALGDPEAPVGEDAPPGREKQVKKLKKKFDDPGAPYAIAWAQHNKHGKPKTTESLNEAAAAADADALIAAIKAFQTAAGLKADGIVGPNTRAKAAELIKDPAQAQTVTTLQTAIKDFQTKAGIAVDGKVGPETMGAVKQAQSGGGAAPAADPNAKAGVDGAADATASAAQGGDATAPTADGPTDAEKDAGAGQAQTAPAQPQTSDQATQQAGQKQAPDPNAQKASQEDPNSTTPVPTDGNAAPQTDAELDADSKDNATPEPAAQPKVSAEKYMQMNDQGPGLANFNVQKMKAKYPEPYLDIPNDDGTVTRAYGPTKNLQAFIDTDSRGKGLKLSGGKAAPAAPAQDTQAPQDDQKQTDQEKDDAQQTDQQQGDQEKDDTQQTDQQQTDKTAQNDADAQDNAQQDQTPPNDDPEGFDAASDVTDDDLNAPDKPGDKPAPKPGKETYTVNGKEMSRNDVAKRLNALLRKARGTSEGISFNSPLARLLTEALSDAEKQELQALIDAVRDSRYFATFINRPKTLKALQDAGIQNIPGKPEKRQRPSRGGDTVSQRKSVRKYYKTDPETGKEVEIDKDEADAMQAKFDKATMTKRDADGKDDFDRALDGDGSFDRALDGDDKDGTTTTSTSSSSKDGNTTRTSSNTSTVTRTGNTSTTKKTSGGGSTTRFSKVMRATDETNKLRAEKKEVRKKMRDFAKQWEKDNPDGDTFGAMDTPEYQALRKEYDSYRGMDGKIAKSKEMVHPGGQIDKDGNIRYNTKDGKWDGEQYDPNRKNDLRDNIQLDRIKVLAGV